MKKQMKVDPIKNGTVIDHISAGKALKVIELLKLAEVESELMLGINLTSNKMGKKDVVKIENRTISTHEANSIALLSPSATIIIIENYEVIKKFVPELPKSIKNYIICPNPNCITNIELMTTNFALANKEPIEVRCAYCEKKYSIDNVRFSI